MKKYLVYLNWCQAIALLLVVKYLYPYIHVSGLIGAFFGTLLTAGTATQLYCEDNAPDKNKVWLENYFSKPYEIEVTATLAATVVMYLLSLCTGFFAPLFRLLTGGLLMFFTNTIVECVWRYTFYIYIMKHKDDHDDE